MSIASVNPQEIARVVKRYRLAYQLTKREAARRAGVSEGTWARIEGGQTQLRDTTLARVADVFDAEVDDFISGVRPLIGSRPPVAETDQSRKATSTERVRALRLWLLCSEILRPQMPDSDWRRIAEAVEPLRADEGSLVLAVPDELTRRAIEDLYLSTIAEVLSKVVGSESPVQLLVRANPLEAEAAGSDVAVTESTEVGRGPIKEAAVRPHHNGASNPKYKFDTFVTGKSNRIAYAAALSVAETPAKSYNPLFIYGGAGLGKTHLLQAIGHHVRGHHSLHKIQYVSTETFMNEFIDAIRTNTTPQFKRRYRECDVLLVDDIQFLENKEGTQEEFFHTFNTIYGAGGQIVISSDRPAKLLVTLEDRLRSRFLSGLITEIVVPELETRLAILRQKASKEATKAPAEVLEFIASHVKRNIRELEGALVRVTAVAELSGVALTEQLAAEVLSDVIEVGSRRVTPQNIMEMTAARFGFDVEELRGPNRRRPLVQARQIAMYLCRELTDLSYPSIAREFGGRDFTTVIHGVEKIHSQMKEHRRIYDDVTELIGQIKTG